MCCSYLVRNTPKQAPTISYHTSSYCIIRHPIILQSYPLIRSYVIIRVSFCCPCMMIGAVLRWLVWLWGQLLRILHITKSNNRITTTKQLQLTDYNEQDQQVKKYSLIQLAIKAAQEQNLNALEVMQNTMKSTFTLRCCSRIVVARHCHIGGSSWHTCQRQHRPQTTCTCCQSSIKRRTKRRNGPRRPWRRTNHHPCQRNS